MNPSDMEAPSGRSRSGGPLEVAQSFEGGSARSCHGDRSGSDCNRLERVGRGVVDLVDGMEDVVVDVVLRRVHGPKSDFWRWIEMLIWRGFVRNWNGGDRRKRQESMKDDKDLGGLPTRAAVQSMLSSLLPYHHSGLINC